MRPFLGRFQTIVRGSSSQAALSLVCLFVLILGVRLIFPGPITEPDSDYYSEVAQNLVKHGCYGWVDEETSACSPVWGNQPPGYPMFLAALQALGLQSLYYAVLAQTVIFAIAATFALWAAYTWHKSLVTLLISGAILAVSPVTIAWPRFVLTETLAGAMALWVFDGLRFACNVFVTIFRKPVSWFLDTKRLHHQAPNRFRSRGQILLPPAPVVYVRKRNPTTIDADTLFPS